MELSRLQYAQKYIHRGVVSLPLYDYEFNNRGPVTYTYTGDVIEGEIPMEPKPDKPNQGGGGDNNSYNGHEYVDLGLPSGTLWATMNVGASTEEGYGDYYAWGETETKSNYTWSTYKFNPSEDGYTMTKYNRTDGLTELEAEDDVAHINWGGDWHIPTFAQMQELVNNCTLTWGLVNGINGYTVSSKNNNNSIFLPVAGSYYATNNAAVGSTGSYWTSSLTPDPNNSYFDMSYDLHFYSSESESHFETTIIHRLYGLSIRPVIDTPSNEPNAMYIPMELVVGGSGNEPTPITWNRQTEKYEAHLPGSFTGSYFDIYMKDKLIESYEDMRSVVFSNLNGVTILEQQAVNNFFNQGRLFIGAGVASEEDASAAGEKSFDTTVTFKDGSSWTLTISWTQEGVA